MWRETGPSHQEDLREYGVIFLGNFFLSYCRIRIDKVSKGFCTVQEHEWLQPQCQMIYLNFGDKAEMPLHWNPMPNFHVLSLHCIFSVCVNVGKDLWKSWVCVSEPSWTPPSVGKCFNHLETGVLHKQSK